MQTLYRTNGRNTRTRKVVELDSVFEDWTRGDTAARLHYHEDAPGGREDRHLVALHWPFDFERQPLAWRFATVEEARVGWAEARLYLEALGFARS